MPEILDAYRNARTPDDIVAATARFLASAYDQDPPPHASLATMRVDSAQDIEYWIGHIEDVSRRLPMLAADERRLRSVLTCLMIASIRVRQLSGAAQGC